MFDLHVDNEQTAGHLTRLWGPMDSFYGDSNARTRDFFDTYADELGPPLDKIARDVGNAFLEKHGAPRLKQVFQLTTTGAEGTIASAGGGTGWRETIEALAGFDFQAPAVPESALGLDGTRVSGFKRKFAMRKVNESETKRPKTTVSADLIESGSLGDALLPNWTFNVVETPNPLVNPISGTDCEAFTDACMQYACEEYGKLNLGMPLCRLWGQQAHKKLKLPDYGLTSGTSRTWKIMLRTKSRNRFYVCP